MRTGIKRLVGLVVGASTFVAGTALAAGAAWSNDNFISDIEVSAGVTYLKFGTAPLNNPCTTANPSENVQVLLSGTADSVRSMASVATAAFLASKPLRIYYDGNCTGKYAKITGVRVF
ncbi:MAG TPA: hypothetical protein VFQ61_34695 [Polyangiaceae bacterium]|nr:hypothetical protein [Polyangiaceae bacterium]